MSGASLPEKVTPREFARRLGFKPHYGNQLARDGRLVFDADGKHVLMAESLALYEQSKDPSRSGVVARHERERVTDQAVETAAVAEVTGRGDEANDDFDGAELADELAGGYQAARAVKERYLALSAKRDYEVEMRQLLPADLVLQELSSAVVTLRASLERMPYELGPQLASVSDENVCTATIADHVHQALEELERAFSEIAGEVQE